MGGRSRSRMMQRPSRIRIDQLLLLGAVVRKHVDESPDLGRQMMAMRIDRIHRKLHRPIFRQQPNQPALFEIVMDQKPRCQRDPDAVQRGGAQRFAAVGDQIAGTLAVAGI